MDLIGARHLPLMTRRNYHYEFLQLCTWSAMAGIVEGNFGSVVVSKSFGAGEWLIAIATATPHAAFTFSLLWGMLCVGRKKLQLLMLFSAGTALLTGMAAAAPPVGLGTIWFIVMMAGAQILMSGVLTTRSALWRSNYPDNVRGQIAAKLQRIRFIASIATSLAAAMILDRDPTSFRYIYPSVAVIGLLSVWQARKLHVRGEIAELTRIRAEPTHELTRGNLVEPMSVTALLRPGKIFRPMIRVLREDAKYRTYCIAQLLMGVANLMTISVVAALVTTRIRLGSGWEFWTSTVLLVGLPQLGVLGSLTRWGKLFDRLGVLSFRVFNVGCWTLSLVFGLLGTLAVVFDAGIGPAYIPLATVCFAFRGLFAGISRGGGTIAWHLGHLHFAKAQDAELYMGIHVFLTGVRGIFAPLLGIGLWKGWGWPVWLVAITLSLSSLILYNRIAREYQQETSAAGDPST